MPGGHDFAFRNDHAGAALGPYSADKWISPEPQPGDLVLFPSYLMHAVPPNPGERRITMAFNAIPTRLDSWVTGSASPADRSEGSRVQRPAGTCLQTDKLRG